MTSLFVRAALFGYGFCMASSAWAQPASGPMPLPASFLPKSPTVAPFQRFDQQRNVDLMTGAAQMAVPLVELTCGPLQVPVSLSYSYTGLKVSQPQDLVGLGWSLQAGGSISRQVVGTLDEGIGGRGYNPDTVFRNRQNQNFLRRAQRGDVDVAPDVYTFAVAGYSGRFLLRDTTVVLLPAQPLKVRRLSPVAFQVAAETGVRYLFEAQELTTPNSNNFGTIAQHVSAWHLTRIISANDADTIHFHYSVGHYSEPSRWALTTGQQYLNSFTANQSGGTNCERNFTFNNIFSYGSVIEVQVLDSICARGARVVFTRNAAHELQAVRLLATGGGARCGVRAFVLAHSLFPGASPWLRLDRVQEQAGATQLPPYVFAYDTTSTMPLHGSTGQDHWGYYNGADSNGSAATAALLPDVFPASSAGMRLGALAADRTPRFSRAACGSLLRSTYPTGGHTDFAYESGQYATPDNSYLSYQGYHKEVFSDPAPVRHIDGARLRPQHYNALAGIAGDSIWFTLHTSTTVRFTVSRSSSEDPVYDKNTLTDFVLLTPGVSSDSVVAAIKVSTTTNTQVVSLTLPAGTYLAWALCDDQEESVAASVDFARRVFQHDAVGPGIRVRQTTTVAPGAPPMVRGYEYSVTENGDTYSSGKTLLPILADGTPGYNSYEYEQSSSGSSLERCFYLNVSSDCTEFGLEYSKYTFFYEQVLERMSGGNGGTGTTVNRFRYQPEFFNNVVLTEQAQYRTGAVVPEQMVQRERYHYRVYEATQNFPALRVWLWHQHNGAAMGFTGQEFTSRAFDFGASFVALDTTRLVRYGAGSDSLVSITATTYRAQRAVRTATRGNGRWNITAVKRLSDYAPSAAGVAALRATNFNPVVEAQYWQRSLAGTDSVVTGGQLTLYDPQWRSPASTWKLEIAAPQPFFNNEFRTSGLYRDFKSDTRYRQVAQEGYDPATGDPVEQRPVHGTPTATLWGYQRTVPVAEVTNASYAQLVAVLGRPAIAQLQSATPGTDDHVRQVLQRLRTQLPAARVTTYTYRPLVGLTSQTGPDGRTTRYEYDALGRLLRTRDEQGRILSQQQYHYTGQ